VEANAAWQAVNKALNATLQMDQVAVNDYVAKVNTVIAGADLPDFIFNPTTAKSSGVIAQLPQFLNSKCVDLTPYLGGDAIKDYPNLAHYSTYSWRSAIADSKIYAIPVARPPINTLMTYRADLFERAGVPLNSAPSRGMKKGYFG
jgi:putative aldouronate transport system substrate-binding protein